MKKTTGIHIENSSDITVEDSSISGFDNGIVSKNNTNMKLRRNNISGDSNLTWYSTWWGILILSVVAGIIVYFIIKLF